ncbi:sensor histidine kinase [Sphingomonas oligophenolica]|uniref:histidine kinase n=1 Tax=Sphingomonas oligophenolica TaxID=301154 RepID=A0A502CKN0_9SPHN|nr:histidine kinase dimerization/phosphoacceptor domain -containing protein [Sphingomonas oligophenolica]TPG13130.1 histidine kinase [Sphingomonas oligophenolica]
MIDPSVSARPDGGFAEPLPVESAPPPVSDSDSASAAPSSALSRLPTGAKLFLILSAALLPLALIAIIATLQTNRVADAEARARLRVATNESARSLAIELVGDTTALRSAVNALAVDPADALSCARVRGVFAEQAPLGTRFAIVGSTGRLLCGSPLPAVAAVPTAGSIAARIVPGQGLLLAVRGRSGRTSGRVFFPRAFIVRLATPTSRALPFASALVEGETTLELSAIAGVEPLDRMETMQTGIGLGTLQLQTSIRSAPITYSLIIALLLPLMMWAAAAGIGWFVVDRLLIRPLRRLRAEVAAYRPGEIIDPGQLRSLPAQEIRELGDTFRSISETVARHEEGLAQSVIRQTKLTREVHHRVKNNLQVIASLINFHARGAPSIDATNAYVSIQRRVDALAVVHRNHFAELEENRGLNLRAVISELASNIRSNAAESVGRIVIALDIDPYLVTQDVGVAIAFLVTETIELAMSCDPAAQIRVAVKPDTDDDARAVLRVVSRSLVASDTLDTLLATRYGRVIEGLSRQLRARLHHDPMVGAYEISFAVVGRD